MEPVERGLLARFFRDDDPYLYNNHIKPHCDNCNLINVRLYKLHCIIRTPVQRWNIIFAYCLDCMRELPIDENTREGDLCRPFPGQIPWPKLHKALYDNYPHSGLYIEKGALFEILGG
jgi:hypothetical protein